MAVLRALAVAAEAVAEVHLVGVVEIAEEARPLLIVVEDVEERRLAQVGEVVGGGIVLLVAVAVAVVQLQEDALCAEVTVAVAIAEGAASLRHGVLGLGLWLEGV